MEFTGSAKIACAKGLFAGEAGLVGFCVVWTREELGFISLEGFLLSLGFLDSKDLSVDKFHVVAEQGVAHVRVWSHSAWCL